MVRDFYGGIDAGDKRFVLIEGADHGLFKKENDEEVFAVIDRWLSERVGKSGQASDAPVLFSSA
jgi:alpha-beta hydrolase superfamily lysophospholipase